jgi:uncharacterized protein YcfJ
MNFSAKVSAKGWTVVEPVMLIEPERGTSEAVGTSVGKVVGALVGEVVGAFVGEVVGTSVEVVVLQADNSRPETKTTVVIKRRIFSSP